MTKRVKAGENLRTPRVGATLVYDAPMPQYRYRNEPGESISVPLSKRSEGVRGADLLANISL